MLLGPELLELSDYAIKIELLDNKTIIYCENNDMALEGIESFKNYFESDEEFYENYSYVVIDNTITLTR
jgi:hypothetical protein